MSDQSTRAPTLRVWSPQAGAGRDRRAEERSPEGLCLLLYHFEFVTTSKIGRMVRCGCPVPRQESQPTLHRKFPERRGQGRVRAVSEGQFLHQKTRLARHCVCGQLVVVRILNQRRVASRHSRIFLFEAAENACRPAPPSFRWHSHTYPNGRQTLAALTTTACSIASQAPPFSPEHARHRFPSVENRVETHLAPSYCLDCTPIGLSKDSVADLWLLRRVLTASKHQFVQEIALLEDSCDDATIVLQFRKIVSRASCTIRLFKESGRRPVCAVPRERW